MSHCLRLRKGRVTKAIPGAFLPIGELGLIFCIIFMSKEFKRKCIEDTDKDLLHGLKCIAQLTTQT